MSSRSYHPAPGTYEVKATLTLGGSAYGLEENKANNEKAIIVEVREGRAPGTSPDLALADVKAGETGGAYQVEATVRNIGIDPATCVFNVALVTEITKGTRQVMKREDVVIPAGQSFAPGAEKKLGPFPIVDKDHPGSLEQGTYHVRVGVYNTIGTYMEESDTKNNYYQGDFTIGKGGSEPPPDFAIKSIRIDPAEPYANSDMNLYVEVENAGPARVDNAQIVVNFSKFFEGQSATASLAPGETKVLSARKYHPAPGNYEIKATLDLGGSAYGLEVNKANNEQTIVFQVREGRAPGTNADLALTDVKAGESGGAYQVEATVRNIGTDPASCVFNVSLVTEVTKGTRQVLKREDVVIPARQPFAPGAEKKLGPFPIVDKDHPDSFEEGTYNVKIGVYNTVGTYMEESDTKNNYYQGTFTVAKSTTTPVAKSETTTAPGTKTETAPGTKNEATTGTGRGMVVPKKPLRPVLTDYFIASSLEILAGEEVTLKWSLPAAAEASIIIDNKKVPLQLPAGEMKVKPSCSFVAAGFCTSTYRIIGKTKTNLMLQREVKIKVTKR